MIHTDARASENRWWIIGDRQPGDHTRHLSRNRLGMRVLHHAGEKAYMTRAWFLCNVMLPVFALTAVGAVTLGLMVWGAFL